MTSDSLPELQDFLTSWSVDPNRAKPLFESMLSLLEGMKGVSLEYKGRPGVSHSLRARHERQRNRSLFVLVDVIDDEPDARWLSICFYDDLVSDPEERGDTVPGGLMGEDARCFDIDEADPGTSAYMLERLKEAAAKAAGSV